MVELDLQNISTCQDRRLKLYLSKTILPIRLQIIIDYS